ncbi:Gmad2 immunoglobulin-like domain-containing protein [Streptomyces sp. NPDC005209]|uniref:GerMN domain-containing protein n=1 Tax=Streptomyces sp. NPDC005209 TaxID=3156715 RepID=UPI0033B62B71
MNSRRSAPCPRRRGPVMLVAALSVPLLVAGACGTAAGPPPAASARPGESASAGSGASGGTSSGPASPGTTTSSATAPRAPATGSTGAAGRHITTAVYLLHAGHISPAPRTVTAPATAAGSVRALLAGPDGYERGHDRTSAIPPGTTLHSVAVRDQVATVDLSGRYDDGGGTVSLRARLAQVVFTVTRYPGIRKVGFELDGKPVSSFGAAGIVLNGPVGRADFEDVSPAVLVESPLMGEGISSPLRVRGSADTFEAEFRLKVTDVSGRTAADVLVRASSGTGTRGTFDVTLPYKAARTGPGLLTAYFISPENGRPVIVDTVPLTVNR